MTLSRVATWPARQLHEVEGWFGLHPRLRRALSALFAVIAVAALTLTLWLHADDSGRISRTQQRQDAQQAHQQEAETAKHAADIATFRKLSSILCPGVWVYVHPAAGPQSPQYPQIAHFWKSIGTLLGCPDGTPPTQ